MLDGLSTFAFLICLAGSAGYIAMVGAYCILGAVLNPAVFLPYAAMASTFTGIVAKMKADIKRTQTKVERKVKDTVEKQMSGTLDLLKLCIMH